MINLRERCNMQIKPKPILCSISHKVDSIVIMITFSLVFVPSRIDILRQSERVRAHTHSFRVPWSLLLLLLLFFQLESSLIN